MRGRPPLPPGPYLVVGLARSGIAAAYMLAPHGEVIGVDSGAPEVSGFEAHLNTDGIHLLDRAGTVVKSPGVPAGGAGRSRRRAARGIPVMGELELAWRLLPNRFVAVTGTNGKTTTTELIGAMYRAAGLPVAVAGNVGTALSSYVGEVSDDTTIVCECSSFQLEDTDQFAPDCAVLLNLEEDHLDRHGTFEAYREAKLRIFANQTAGRRGDQAAGPAARSTPARCACAGRTTWRTPSSPRRPRARWASPTTRSPRRCARSRASRTGSRRSPTATACST